MWRRAGKSTVIVIGILCVVTLAAVSLAVVATRLGPDTWSSSERAAPGEWPSYGGTNWSQKYSPLAQVTKANFKNLRVAWIWDSPDRKLLGEIPPSAESPLHANGLKATPLMVKGVMYVSTGLGQIAAIDPASGKTKWLYNPEAYKSGPQANVIGWQSRGVSYWTDGAGDERILFGTLDAYLIALDAKTGKPISTFGSDGRADLTTAIRGAKRNTLHLVAGERHYLSVDSPPVLVRDTVVVGSTISDRPPTEEWIPGDVQAFDVRTGKLKWVFHVIPKDGEVGADTWKDNANRYTGSANVWSMMSGDDELGLVYLPTSTPNSDYWGGARKGDGLFAESIVAVDVETGKRAWHFQGVHHGVWDYDFPAAPTLLNLTVDGKKIKALAQSSKQAFLYVFDRATGKPLWPIQERPVPQSDVPGEETSPTQPFPTKPAAFDRQGVTKDDVLDFTPELQAKGVEILSRYRIGPLFTPPSLYSKDGTWGTLMAPTAGGGANWSGSGADPETGFVYVPSTSGLTLPTLVELPEGVTKWTTVAPLNGTMLRYAPEGKIGPASQHPDNPPQANGPEGLPLLKPPYSRMTAYDLNTGTIAWQVPTGIGRARIRNNPALAGLILPALGGQGGPGGVLVTKTLIAYGLMGSGAPGAPPGELAAYDKQTGATVAALPLPGVPLGTPMSFELDGKQYIALTLRDGRLISLALPSGNEPRAEQAQNIDPLPAQITTAALHSQLPAGLGQAETVGMCVVCHDLGIITQKRRSKSDWEATVNDMMMKGAVGSDEEATTVIEYLTKNFAPD